jgi:hypothetical protein
VIKIPGNGNVPFAYLFRRIERKQPTTPALVFKRPGNGNVPFTHVFIEWKRKTVNYPPL